MNQLYMISFSPTGTSRRVAEGIAEAFSNEKTVVDLCEETVGEMQIGKEDICIFSAPCYGGRIPQTAAERLSHIHGEQTPAIVLITFGNRAFEDALLELADSVEKNGFRVIAGCAVSAEHNIMHIFGQGRPDGLDWKEIRRFSNAAAEKINAGETERPLLPGSRPYKERHGGKPPILVNEKTCVKCGLCAQKCPVKAISPDGRHLKEELCIACMRCIQLCPQNSRSIPKTYVDGLIQRLGDACRERKRNEFYL